MTTQFTDSPIVSAFSFLSKLLKIEDGFLAFKEEELDLSFKRDVVSDNESRHIYYDPYPYISYICLRYGFELHKVAEVVNKARSSLLEHESSKEILENSNLFFLNQNQVKLKDHLEIKIDEGEDNLKELETIGKNFEGEISEALNENNIVKVVDVTFDYIKKIFDYQAKKYSVNIQAKYDNFDKNKSFIICLLAEMEHLSLLSAFLKKCSKLRDYLREKNILTNNQVKPFKRIQDLILLKDILEDEEFDNLHQVIWTNLSEYLCTRAEKSDKPSNMKELIMYSLPLILESYLSCSIHESYPDQSGILIIHYPRIGSFNSMSKAFLSNSGGGVFAAGLPRLDKYKKRDHTTTVTQTTDDKPKLIKVYVEKLSKIYKQKANYLAPLAYLFVFTLILFPLSSVYYLNTLIDSMRLLKLIRSITFIKVTLFLCLALSATAFYVSFRKAYKLSSELQNKQPNVSHASTDTNGAVLTPELNV